MLIKSIVFIVFIAIISAAQDNTRYVTDTLRINPFNTYYLSNTAPVAESAIVTLQDSLLSNYNDYEINYQLGELILSDKLQYSLFDTLYVTYRIYPLSLRKNYFNREIQKLNELNTAILPSDSKTKKNILSPESIFGSRLKKNGSIIRGFKVGTTNDFSLTSGLRLQLVGNLSDDIEIIAALTDENTPIQPDGNTERLEEIDKVFIELKHKYAKAVFGDFELIRKSGEFGVINRKLQGITSTFNYNKHSGGIVFAGAKGKFTTNSLIGIEGVQGPYRLTGENNQNDIIIIAGSERIYIDGIVVQRGSNNDYTIEYANAEVTFTPSRIITSDSRIFIEFEYTDRKYERNTLGMFYSGNITENFTISSSFFREGDDYNSPIDLVLSDDEKEILSNAGDNYQLASVTGVSLAQPDSLGNINGIYTKADTLIENEIFEYYIYKPGEITSAYNVTFSYVGEGNGDYNRISIGNYLFIGKGNGSYLPIKTLPLPEIIQNGNILLSGQLIPGFTLSLESAFSSYDKNIFSSIDDNDNSGFAGNVNVLFLKEKLNLLRFYFYNFELKFKGRYVNSKYASFDRYNEVEFNRKYNIQSVEENDEYLTEASVKINPLKHFELRTEFGGYRKGTEKTERLNSGIVYEGEKLVLNLNFEKLTSKNSFSFSDWIKTKNTMRYKFDKFDIGTDFELENKEIKSKDSLLGNSLKFNQISPFITIQDIYGFNLNYRIILRENSFPYGGVLQKESFSNTNQFSLDYLGSKNIKSTINVSFRKKNFTNEFLNIGFKNTETVLIKSANKFFSDNRFFSGELFYETASERTAKLQRVFIKVETGKGNYIYLGDLNNNGIAEENEYQLDSYEGDFIQQFIPTDELFPSINLKFSSRLEIEFDRIEDGTNFLNFLNFLTSETVFRIDENNKNPNTSEIYFLNLSKFLDDEFTVSGSQFFGQDIHLFKGKREYSFRIRYNKRKSLNQYSSGTEKGLNSELSFRSNVRLVKEIGIQTDIAVIKDELITSEQSFRTRDVSGYRWETDLSYRPNNLVEFGFIISGGNNVDIYPENPTEIFSNGQKFRFNLSLAGKGRFRAEIERIELETNTNENTIPYEITKGNFIGKNYYWKLEFDYKLAGNIQVNTNYDGRFLGGGRVINTLRAEVKAYF